MSASDSSAEEFLAKCEEELKDRYTERDEEFMKVHGAEPSKPPIVESWWPSQHSGRRYDRRFNRRFNPMDSRDRHNDGRRGHNDRRGYNDYGDRGYGDRGYGDRGYGDRGYGDRSYGDRSHGNRNQRPHY